MSVITNSEGAKPGSIYRISLVNFVTYKEVELYPGFCLNLIIGPNGTGKSTFVCAIILGLCGKTNIIGRAKKISEYVRSGCAESTIEIELYQEPGQRNVIITRIFNLEGQSTWKIDRKTVREKQVQDLISSLNIQVDNMCQLLPQDRVQDFSKMNPQELLRSTLAAVGGHDSVSQLDELIETRKQQKNLGNRQTNNSQMLQEQQRLNERLKTQIDAMIQRKEIEKQIAICQKKKLWLEYQELRSKVVGYNNDRDKASQLLTRHKNKVAPLEATVKDAKAIIHRLEQQKLTSSREVQVMKDKIRDNLKCMKTHEGKIKQAETIFLEKLEIHKNREREVREAKTVLDKLIVDRDRMVQIVGDESKVKTELATLQKPIMKTNAAIDTLKKQKLEAQYDLDNNVTPQIRLYQNKIRQLNDASSKRLEVLRSCSEDAYAAVVWLRDNRHMFKNPVYEPMVLEINFTEAKFARYLESTVANRDLLAFTFESSQDMNLFLRKVRMEKGLRQVNAICSPPGNSVFKPPCRIEDLSYLGFGTYLVDTITAPEAITRYLCKQYNIHRIPIGNDHTYNNSGKVPANITFFFTSNHRFTVRVSAYSGAKSSSTVEIRPARLLANTIDVDQLNSCTERLESFERTAQERRQKLHTFDSKLKTLEEGLNELYNQKKIINENIEKVKAICAQIRVQTKKVQDIESAAAFNVQQEKEKCKRMQKDAARKQCQIQTELSALVKDLHDRVYSGDVLMAKLELHREGIVNQEAELRVLKSELANMQGVLENVENLLLRAKNEAKEKLKEAKSSCNNRLPQEPEFPYREQFEELPVDIRELEEHCYELQTRIECMDRGDEQIIKEYEEREKLINRLKSEVNNSTSVQAQLRDKLDRIRRRWLPPLERVLAKIDREFGEMFAVLGCAGEVRLDAAAGEEEYEQYGVSIMVKFRAEEQLSRLTRHAQSGGERALTIALYLMALQKLAAVPFRCVDEINQGMDPVNERKMFQLLVKVTTESDNAQYFLLSPKLLMKLEYNPRVTVHAVMNGRRVMGYEHWDVDAFVRNARNYSA